ncbi:type II secretion system F family protein [Aggregatilinea lenta]|uniref:type II secretion system F family protein n=1 Tax=Aggregatilinea lenta TaxID=913108 RepID=UPI000E5B7C48|nr:type II secretion system F family protein [Aggregatilinea lenta]
MSSSKSSVKHGDKTSFKPVPPFDLFYQMTYMSAMAAAGLSRSKTFEVAAQSHSTAAEYFEAINTLVDEFRYDYPEACRRIGVQAKSENMRSFLLRFSDALRSGEPMAEFLVREANVQSADYENKYERNLEAMKQWTNAFTSITISVALIVIIQVISSMIYSMDSKVMTMLIGTGVVIAAFGAWIIWRSAPQETMTVKASEGSAEQRRALSLIRMLGPLAFAGAAVLNLAGVPIGWILVMIAALLVPVGVIGFISDKKTTKKDEEFSTFLRSAGSMATSTGTTMKQALTVIDLSSFPTLEPDIVRLSTRLQALVEPEVCWKKFGVESGSKLISEVTDIFYGGIKMGGDPERVGFLCSLFTAKTTQLRAKRRLVASTFAGLSTVMQGVIAGIMVFVLSIVFNFAEVITELMPTGEGANQGQASMNMAMASFSPGELQFLNLITTVMILLLAVIGATATILSDGGFRLKGALYLALTIFISGICFLVVPSLVGGILTM